MTQPHGSAASIKSSKGSFIEKESDNIDNFFFPRPAHVFWLALAHLVRPLIKNYRFSTVLTTGHELHAMLRIRQVIYEGISEDAGKTSKR